MILSKHAAARNRIRALSIISCEHHHRRWRLIHAKAHPPWSLLLSALSVQKDILPGASFSCCKEAPRWDAKEAKNRTPAPHETGWDVVKLCHHVGDDVEWLVLFLSMVLSCSLVVDDYLSKSRTYLIKPLS